MFIAATLSGEPTVSATPVLGVGMTKFTGKLKVTAPVLAEAEI
jgi:hypothetical protein